MEPMCEPPDIVVGAVILAAFCCIVGAVACAYFEGFLLYIILFAVGSWITGRLFRHYVER